MNNVTQMSNRIKHTYSVNEEGKHVQTLLYTNHHAKEMPIFQAVSSMGWLPMVNILEFAFEDIVFFKAPHIAGEALVLDPKHRVDVIQDLLDCIRTYHHYDIVRNNVKGNRDFELVSKGTGLKVLVVPYITKGVIFTRYGDDIEQKSRNGDNNYYQRHVMIKHITEMGVTVSQNVHIGELFEPVDFNYDVVIKEMLALVAKIPGE